MDNNVYLMSNFGEGHNRLISWRWEILKIEHFRMVFCRLMVGLKTAVRVGVGEIKKILIIIHF